MVDGTCVGTAAAVALGPGDVVVVTALHCLQEGKKLLPATAFDGQKLNFVLANPCHDLVVFKVDCPPEQALRFSTQSSHTGQRVALMAYPLVVDAELVKVHADDQAMFCQGWVVRTYATSHIVLADYRGGANPHLITGHTAALPYPCRTAFMRGLRENRLQSLSTSLFVGLKSWDQQLDTLKRFLVITLRSKQQV